MRLLLRQLKASSILGILLASSMGFVLVLMGIEAYLRLDANKALPRGQGSRLIIQSDRGLDRESLTELKAQDWVHAMAGFETLAYRVEASLPRLPQMPQLKTELFIEAVPDAMLDVLPEDWSWQEGDTDLKLIVPRSYLSLYNLGFAASQGLPQIPEELIYKLPFILQVYKDGEILRYSARVAAFSTEINSILAPLAFVRSLNTDAPKQDKTHRAVVLVSSLNDPKLQEYMGAHDIATEQKLGTNKAERTLYLIAGGIVGAGIMLLAIALLLYSISLQLLLHGIQQKIRVLAMMGFSSWRLAQPIHVFSALIILGSYFISFFVYQRINQLLANKLPMLWAQPTQTPLVAFAILVLALLLAMLQSKLSIKRILKSSR